MAKNPTPKTEAFVKWFRSATPYIHQWGGATFVIAFGGEVLADGEFQQLTHDINVLVSLDVRVVGWALRTVDQFPPPGIFPLADHVHALVVAGFITSKSVGFRPVAWRPTVAASASSGPA